MATIRQRLAAKKLSENIRKKKPKPMGKVLLEAGYSKRTSEAPQRVTQTKAWPALMKEFLGDALLAKTHNELINAGDLRKFEFPFKFTDAEIKSMIESAPGCRLLRVHREIIGRRNKIKTAIAFMLVPDGMVRRLSTEMAYKLKGRFAPEQHEVHFDEMDESQLVSFIIGKIAEKK